MIINIVPSIIDNSKRAARGVERMERRGEGEVAGNRRPQFFSCNTVGDVGKKESNKGKGYISKGKKMQRYVCRIFIRRISDT